MCCACAPAKPAKSTAWEMPLQLHQTKTPNANTAPRCGHEWSSRQQSAAAQVRRLGTYTQADDGVLYYTP